MAAGGGRTRRIVKIADRHVDMGDTVDFHRGLLALAGCLKMFVTRIEEGLKFNLKDRKNQKAERTILWHRLK